MAASRNNSSSSSGNRYSHDSHKNDGKSYATTTMDHRDDRDRDVSLVGDEEEEEEESIETHILQYGHDGTPSLNSQSTRESAADRRRRRALEQQQQHERSLARASHSKGANRSKKNEEATGHVVGGGESSVASSTVTDGRYGKSQGHSSYSPRRKGGSSGYDKKDSLYYDDPPLELYSEESDDESDEVDNSDNNGYDDLKHHSPNKAINVQRKDKKKGGFSRVKNFIRMGVSEDFFLILQKLSCIHVTMGEFLCS
jgi:hypothetical protein